MDTDPRDRSQQVLNQLRARIHRLREASDGHAPAPAIADSGVTTDLRALHEGYDAIFRVDSTPRPTPRQSVAIWLQRVRRRLLAPLLLRQVAHNAATTRLISHLLGRQARGAMDDSMAENLRRLEVEATEVARRQTNLDELTATVRAQDLRIRQLEGLLGQSATPGPRSTPTVAGPPEEQLDDALYAALEDEVRGSRAQVMDACREYLPILKAAGLGTAESPVLDVGCGRGEWLELLRDEDLHGYGVDRNLTFVEACRARGLTAIRTDALAYLQSVPAATLGAVTGFHILEHLPYAQVIATLDETVRVLKPGGVAIFETPDPENVWVGTHFFYIDPSHQRPLPSVTLKFLAKARGLDRIEIRRLHPFAETRRLPNDGLAVTRRFNEHFYGPQDYALIGWKRGA